MIFPDPVSPGGSFGRQGKLNIFFMNRIFLLFFLLAFGLTGWGQSNPAKPKKPVVTPKAQTPQAPRVVTLTKVNVGFTPELIQRLRPKEKVRGNDNFNGKSYVTVNMYYRYNRVDGDSIIKLMISLSGEEDNAETGSDARTLIRDDWELVIYRAPAGYKIKGIAGDVSAYFSFYADPKRTKTLQNNGNCKGSYYSLRAGTLGFEFDAKIISDIQFAVQFEGADYNPSPTYNGCQFEIRKLQLKPMTITLEKI